MSGCHDMIFPSGLVSSGCKLRPFELGYSVSPQAIHDSNYLSEHVRLLNWTPENLQHATVYTITYCPRCILSACLSIYLFIYLFTLFTSIFPFIIYLFKKAVIVFELQNT
jgi:hypothetical protein